MVCSIKFHFVLNSAFLYIGFECHKTLRLKKQHESAGKFILFVHPRNVTTHFICRYGDHWYELVFEGEYLFSFTCVLEKNSRSTGHKVLVTRFL